MAVATAMLDDEQVMPVSAAVDSLPRQDRSGQQDDEDDDDDVAVNVGDLGSLADLDNDFDDAGRQAQYSALRSGDDDDDDFMHDNMDDDPVVNAHRSRMSSTLAELPRAKTTNDEDDDDGLNQSVTITSSGNNTFDYFYDSPGMSPTSAVSSTALVTATTSTYGPTIGPANKGSSYGSYGPYRRGNATRNPFTGLSNQGATCYMNSLLQTMFMTPELRLGLYRWKYEDGDHPDENSTDDEDNIPYQLQKLFAKLQTTTQESISTKALTKSFGWTGADVFQQHDVQELNRVLFDALEKSFKGTINETLVNDLYQGTMKDYVQCRTCGYESSRQDEFLDLSLVIRPFGSTQMMKSVEEAIELFLKPEVLDGDNQWMCDRCQTKRDAIKGLKFSKLPYLLSLQLKRFDYDYMTDSRVKLHDQVTFPKYLNMNTYVHSEGGGPRGSIARKMSMERHELEASREAGAAAERTRRMSSMDESNPVVVFPDQDDLSMSPSEIANTWAPDFDVDSLIDQSGPSVYELYSVLIHSGSALGGHYYAYIKSFETGKWYDFNDSTVSELSENEVKKAWGGSGNSSGHGGYGGRISYSTCAYMLMYRLVSRERNVNSAPKESIPEYLTERMREEEERHKRQELERIELTKKMLIKFYMKTNSKNKLEKSLHIYKTATLREALVLAHEAFAKDLGDAMPKLENTRIRLFNDYTGMVSESYEGREEKTLTELKMYSSYQLYLDVRNDGEEWEAYEPRKLQLYIRRFSLPGADVPVGPDLTARYVQVPDDVTVSGLLRVIAAKFSIPPHKKIRLVRKMATSYTSTPIKVLNRDETPETLGARLRNEHHVTNGNELYYEECDDLSAPSVAEEHFEREVNVIEINIWYQERLTESIRIDRRETVLALKHKIAEKLQLSIDKFKVLRGNHRAGIEIKSTDMTLFNLSMSHGHAIYVQEGIPLGTGEYLFRLMLCKPPSYSKSSDESEPTLTVTSSKGDEEKDLFDLDEVMVRTNQEESALEYITNVKVGEDQQVEDVRKHVWETLKEKEKIPADGSITPSHIRLRDVQSTTLTRILVDGVRLKDASGAPLYEGRGMVAQLLPEPETAKFGHRVVQVVYVDRSKWRFCKRRRFDLIVPKEHVGEDPDTDDDEQDDAYMNAGSMSLALTSASGPTKRHTASSTALVSTWIPEQIALRFTIPPEQARFAVFPFEKDTFDVTEIFKTDFDTWDRCLNELRDRQYNYQLIVFVADADVHVGSFSARERMLIHDFISKKRDEYTKASERSYSSYSNYRKPREAALVIRTKASKSSDKKGGGSTASSNGGESASTNGGVSIRTPTSKRIGASSDTDEDDELDGGASLFD